MVKSTQTLLLHTEWIPSWWSASGWDHLSCHSTTYNGMLHNISLFKMPNKDKSMCTKVNISHLDTRKQDLKVNVSISISELLSIVCYIQRTLFFIPWTLHVIIVWILGYFRDRPSTRQVFESSIIPSVHFSLPQSLKQNHFAVPSHALSVTFFSLEFIQWIWFDLFQFFPAN